MVQNTLYYLKLKRRRSCRRKLVVMNGFKAIGALPARKSSVIRKIEVGLNVNPGRAWNIALYSEFDNLDDVKFYATHPSMAAPVRFWQDKGTGLV